MIRAQAIVRGWLLRKRLRQNGPGVLKRKTVTNDEDLLTYDDVKTLDPFEYFGFEQNGKTWGFAFPTLWKWCLRSEEPTNPYTKLTLDNDILRRLHAVWSYRFRHKLPLPDEPSVYGDRLLGRIHIVCQVFANYGFGSVSPELFRRMTKAQYLAVFRMLFDDVHTVIADTNPNKRIALAYCVRVIQTVHALQTDQYILQSMYALMLMLLRPKDPYVLAFTVLSALYRA